MNTWILSGETERVEILALNASLGALTGLTDLLVSIRRTSDGYWYDFADDTFKNAGWTTRQIAMAEVSAVTAAGEYYHDFDTSAITNPTDADIYEVRVDQ